MGDIVRDAFDSKGLGEDIALLNARLAKILQVEDYDFPENVSSPGPPEPMISLTMEQEFKMRQIEDALKTADKEDIITVF